MPLQPFTYLPIPAPPPFQQTKGEAEAILLSGAGAPLPPAIAGPVPRIKIGRSIDPRARIRDHVRR